MPDRPFLIILDAPQGEPPARVQIAKLGDDFNDPRYGDFAITLEEVAEWNRNLALLPGGIALIDEDHLADKVGPARRTEASGWITGVQLEDDVPMASVEWTPKGKSAIEERRYLFFSPVFGPYTDERGVTHSNVLTGGALTNKPFLNMPAISLSTAAFDPRMLDDVSAEQRREYARSGIAMSDGSFYIRNRTDLENAVRDFGRSGSRPDVKAHIVRRARALGATDMLPDGWAGAPSDSPRQMSTQATHLTKLAAALGLDEDADEPKLLEAIEQLTDKATAPATEPKPEPTKTLEQQADEQGKVLLDRTQVDALNTAASKVPALEETVKTLTDERHEARFRAAWDKAIDELRAAPAEEEAVRELYDANPDATLKMLDARTPIANATPKGSGAADEDEIPAGVKPESYLLDKQVRAFMVERSETDYMKALEAVQHLNAIGGGA